MLNEKKKNCDLCLYVLSTLALLGLLNIIPHLFIYLIIIILVWYFSFLKKKKKKSLAFFPSYSPYWIE